MSYKVNVRSEPILARTEDSDRLNRTAEMVSVEVGKVRFDMAALLRHDQMNIPVARQVHILVFIPHLHYRRSGGEERIRTMVVNRANIH